MKITHFEDEIDGLDVKSGRNPKATRDEFEKLTRPLIKFLNDNYDPHHKIIIDTGHAEMLSGEYAFSTDDYIKD